MTLMRFYFLFMLLFIWAFKANGHTIQIRAEDSSGSGRPNGLLCQEELVAAKKEIIDLKNEIKSHDYVCTAQCEIFNVSHFYFGLPERVGKGHILLHSRGPSSKVGRQT